MELAPDRVRRDRRCQQFDFYFGVHSHHFAAAYRQTAFAATRAILALERESKGSDSERGGAAL